VTFSVATPVSALSSVIVTPGSTPPVVSRTVPTTEPVSNCAQAGAASSPNSITNNRMLTSFPLSCAVYVEQKRGL